MSASPLPSPLPSPLFVAPVQKDWIDYNGHMNDAYYALVFSRAVDRLMQALGLQTVLRTRDCLTIYTVSLIIHYLREAHLGENLAVAGRVLEYDAKRLRLWLSMTRETGEEIAQSEQLLLCVDQAGAKPRAARFPDAVLQRLRQAIEISGAAPWPKNAGRAIRLQKAD